MSNRDLSQELNQQAANALLASIFEFLRRNQIDVRSIIEFTRKYNTPHHGNRSLRLYRKLEAIYDDMGAIMATWYSDPKFLDVSGRPRPLCTGKRANSITQLVKASGARMKPAVAVELLKQSPSISITDNGMVVPSRRLFVLPKVAIPRAAFIVRRYLETLQKNILTKAGHGRLLLERSCYVSEANLTLINPTLRDIDGRATAFMDSVDGEIEGLRLRKTKGKPVGELGVFVFAWTKPKSKQQSKVKKSI
jgi:hypothetical protein